MRGNTVTYVPLATLLLKLLSAGGVILSLALPLGFSLALPVLLRHAPLLVHLLANLEYILTSFKSHITDLLQKSNMEPAAPSSSAVLRIHDNFVWIRIRRSMSLTNRSGFRCGSCYVFSSLTFKTPKKNVKKSFSAYYFLKIHLHHFSKMKSQKEVTKQ
jgi:hypothetical protein